MRLFFFSRNIIFAKHLPSLTTLINSLAFFIDNHLDCFDDSSSVARLLNFDLTSKSNERRHSITVCETPGKTSSGVKKSKESNNNRNDVDDELIVDPNEDTRDRVASIWAATDWGKTYDCLSLTLDEVQHIRSVLTKAEMESLAVTRTLREDLEKGKICFTCLKTRFSYFGPWKVVCKLCERNICEKCSTTMHVPSDCLAKVPVYMLSPTPSPPGDDYDPHFFPKFPIDSIADQFEETTKKASEVLKTSSKKSSLMRALTLAGKSDEERSQFSSMTSTASDTSGSSSVTSSSKVTDSSKKLHYDRHAPLMKLCRDCKLLIRHLIDVGHTNYDSELSTRSSSTHRRPTLVASSWLKYYTKYSLKLDESQELIQGNKLKETS